MGEGGKEEGGRGIEGGREVREEDEENGSWKLGSTRPQVRHDTA